MRTGWMGGLLGALALACARPGVTASDRAEGFIVERQAQLARQSLAILGRDLDDEVLEAILADPRVPELKDLSLGRNKLTARAVRAIVASPKAARLTVLTLDINPLGDEGLVELARWPGLATVDTLMVSYAGATSVGVRALAASPHLTALKRATFGFQAVGDDGAVALAALPASEWIQLDRAEIGPTGARALLAGARTPSLSLNHNAVGAGGLVGLPGLSPALTSISLQETGLGPADAIALAALPAPALRVLDLEYTDLGDAGVQALAAAPWLAQLEALNVAYTRASDATYAALRASWGERGGLTAGDGRAP